MAKQIKAVIFDMDGVLIDAKEWHYGALNDALIEFGCEPISLEEHHSTYDGLPTKKKLELLYQLKGRPAPEQHAAMDALKQRYTEEHIKQKCAPYILHHDALTQLQKNGYKMACCSNSIRNSIDLMLSKADLMKYFEFTLSNQDVINPKPDPEIYIKAMQRLGVAPNETLVCEDNPNGIRAARESGAYVLEIRTIDDVNWSNIYTQILAINSGGNIASKMTGVEYREISQVG